MFAIQDETDLLPAVYDGPFEQPMWSTLLDRLRQRTRADHAGILFHLPHAAHSQLIELHSGTPVAAQVRRFFTGTPSLLREERVYAGDEIFEGAEEKAARIVRVTEPGGLSAWLMLRRAGVDFTSADAALLSRLAPHFRRALRSYSEIERQRARARIASDVMERLNFGWIRLDAKGRILETSEAAANLLQHGAGLRRTSGGRLIAHDAMVDRRLTAAIRAAGERTVSQPRAINISADPWVDLLLVPGTEVSMGIGTSAPGAAMIAYIQGDNRSLADRHDQIAELFGLLPSEARFALLLSRGLSIADAGASLGLTIETARNYSKKIYAKTGARGQADLVRFILTSVLSLA
jgi:DNA-binding CsgD family transcriptional regulator